MVDCMFPYHNPELEGTHDPRPTEMCQMSPCYVLLTFFHKFLSDGPLGGNVHLQLPASHLFPTSIPFLPYTGLPVFTSP